MRTIKEIVMEKTVIDKVFCDVCKKEIKGDLELQETICIYNECGYGSIFGDGNIIECDICQSCLKEKLGKYIRYL